MSKPLVMDAVVTESVVGIVSKLMTNVYLFVFPIALNVR